MNGIIHFETFLLAGVLLNVTPGNDTIFILSRSIAQGHKAGIMSVLGITTGSVIHTLLAALGLSIIIARSLVVFNVIKFAGAAYLVYLGVKMIMERQNADMTSGPVKVLNKPGTIYRDAVMTNLLNPKVALFFIAFLPQFIDPAHRDTILPFLALGITFTITGTLWCLLLVAFASFIAGKLKQNKRISGYVNKACGIVLIGLGIKVALTARR